MELGAFLGRHGLYLSRIAFSAYARDFHWQLSLGKEIMDCYYDLPYRILQPMDATCATREALES